MEQINSILIKNFRSLNGDTWFNISPITVLTGPNNSGKSSFTKSLLFLKTNAEKILSLKQLSYTDDNLGLQSFDTTKNNKSTDDEITFTINHQVVESFFDGENYSSFLMKYFTIKANKDGIKEIRVSNFIPEHNNNWENNVEAKIVISKKMEDLKQTKEVNADLDFVKISRVAFSQTLEREHLREHLFDWQSKIKNNYEEFFSKVVKKKVSHLTEKEKEKLLNAFIIESFQCALANFNFSDSTTFGIEHISSSRVRFSLAIENGLPKKIVEGVMKRFNIDNFFTGIKFREEEIYFSVFAKNKSSILIDFLDNLARYIQSVKYPLKKFFFIPANRHSQNKFINISKPESYFEVLLSQNALIRNKEEWRHSEVRKAILSWLSIFDLAEDFDYEIIGDSLIELRFMKANGKWYNLTELGYGYSQIVPVILSCLLISFENLSSEDSYRTPVIIIEEPEANLHPTLQSKLADFFNFVSTLENIRIIVETHSEYLIRKLQYLTMKQELKPTDTQIYYFYNPDKVPEGEPQVKTININEDGSLTDDFGTGFFDEADKIAMSIWSMNNAKKN